MPQQINEDQVKSLATDLAAKAPLASPALTGTPTGPTPASGDNSTKLATTAFVQSAKQSTVGVTIDGGGSAPATGVKGFIQVPYGGTIIGWSLVGDVSGSASLDVWKVGSSAPPSAPGVPTSTNLISASAPCALSSAQSASGGATAISTWTTAVSQWDVFGFNLSSAATVTRLTLQIQIQRS